jgi:hypothetical protein
MPEPALVLDFEVLEVALRQEPIVARIYSSHVMLVCTLAVSLSAKLITSIHFGNFNISRCYTCNRGRSNNISGPIN